MQSTETQSHSQRSLTSLVTSVAHTCQSTLTPIHQLPMIPRNAGYTMTTYYKESLSYEKARLATCFSRKKGCCRPSIKWRRKISQTIHFNPVDSSVLRQLYNLTLLKNCCKRWLFFLQSTGWQTGKAWQKVDVMQTWRHGVYAVLIFARCVINNSSFSRLEETLDESNLAFVFGTFACWGQNKTKQKRAHKPLRDEARRRFLPALVLVLQLFVLAVAL